MLQGEIWIDLLHAGDATLKFRVDQQSVKTLLLVVILSISWQESVDFSIMAFIWPHRDCAGAVGPEGTPHLHQALSESRGQQGSWQHH